MWQMHAKENSQADLKELEILCADALSCSVLPRHSEPCPLGVEPCHSWISLGIQLLH